MSICLLSAAEAGRLEHWKIWPRCVEHKHCSRAAADDGVKNGLYRYLDGPNGSPVSMVAPVRVTIWTPVSTSMPDGVKLKGFKVWGLKPQR